MINVIWCLGIPGLAIMGLMESRLSLCSMTATIFATPSSLLLFQRKVLMVNSQKAKSKMHNPISFVLVNSSCSLAVHVKTVPAPLYLPQIYIFNCHRLNHFLSSGVNESSIYLSWVYSSSKSHPSVWVLITTQLAKMATGPKIVRQPLMLSSMNQSPFLADGFLSKTLMMRRSRQPCISMQKKSSPLRSV